MKPFHIIFICNLFLFSRIQAQSSLNDLNILVKQDFENNSLGDYNLDEWARDWPNSYNLERMAEMDIVQDVSDIDNPSKSFQFNFPKGTMSPWNGGGSWYFPIPKQDELYCSYDLMFMPGFEFQKGGKLPSIIGGNFTTDKPTGYDGFTGGLMFSGDGYLRFYIYYPDGKLDIGGTSFTWGSNNYSPNYFKPSQVIIEYGSGLPVYLQPGEWHNITYRMVLNTINSSGTGNYDGILEAYYDGKLVTQVTHLLFRHTANIGIDCMRMYSFFGGGDDSWESPIDQWLRVDNVMLYSFKDNIDVPRGNMLSPTNRTINYWRQLSLINTEPPIAPSSLSSTSLTKSSITLRWNDNSRNEYGFRILRSLASDGEFTEVFKTTANITTYTNSGLNPSTTYYYKIQSFNDVGNSDFSNVISATTESLKIPAVPSELSAVLASNTSIRLTWKDNSNNENGFILEKTGPGTTVTSIPIASNTVAYTDAGLRVSTLYKYRVRAYNDDGFTSYTSSFDLSTPYIVLPSAPSSLKTSDLSDISLTINWKDNSVNETGFAITRSAITPVVSSSQIFVSANDTSFTDLDLIPNTTYAYIVKAVNDAGNSGNSNKNVTSTLSSSETKRIKDGLIAYYNFGQKLDNMIYDLSGYSDPLNLKITNPSSVTWNDYRKLNILSPTLISSVNPASKIISSIKKTGEFTFECWIKPEEPGYSTASRLISLSLNDNQIGFVLDQIYNNSPEKSNFSYRVRLSTESTTTSGYPELLAESSEDRITLKHLAFVHDSLGNERFFINGKKVSSGFRSNSFDNWSSTFVLKLGNESDNHYPWQGTFYSMALFNKALNADQISKNFSVGPCDSISNLVNKWIVNVYPNPVNENTSIVITPMEVYEFIPETYFEIVDLHGRILVHREIFNANMQNVYDDIDFSKYAKGLYLLRFVSGSENNSVKLVVL